MMLRYSIAALLCSWIAAIGASAEEPQCPKQSESVQATCKEISYGDLPQAVTALLKKLKCEVGPGNNYGYGSAVDLNGDGSPEYQFCCSFATHGPCGSVLIGKVGTEWRDLTAKYGFMGYVGACNGFIILESQHGGYHDVCLPSQCSPVVMNKTNKCEPTIWHFSNGRYRPVDFTPAKPSK